MNNQLYCSIDIEASGFDPEKDEILEIGFVFFEFIDGRVNIVEEWSKVFNPSCEVSHYILGLTGITQAELLEADKFEEFREFLRQKLSHATLVGHSINTDAKFLESQGIELYGKRIDTLDLVQIILPTYHSYNLENLMHLFGLSRDRAHRALTDAKATMGLLEKLLAIFQSFPQPVKEKIHKLSDSYNLSFKDLFEHFVFPISSPVKEIDEEKVILPEFSINDSNNIINFSQHTAIDSCAISAALKSGRRTLIVLPHDKDVRLWWKRNLAKAIVPPGQVFSPNKFSALLERTDLSLDEVKFALKILVWSQINWQTDSLADLNLTFSGSQFKTLVAEVFALVPFDSALVCIDQVSFFDMLHQEQATDLFGRDLFILGLAHFERGIMQGLGRQVSWGYVMYILKTYYNPEMPEVNSHLAGTVAPILDAADLFFGLAHALLNGMQTSKNQIIISGSLLYSHAYQQLKAAANNFCKKLLQVNTMLQSTAILEIIQSFNDFFAEKDNTVCWVELSESRCVFYCSQVDIRQIAEQVLANFKKITFFESKPEPRILEYFVKRLGLEQFGIVYSQVSGEHKVFDDRNVTVCKILPKDSGLENIRALIKPDLLPTAIVFNDILSLKKFYHDNYGELQNFAHIFNHAVSTGTSRVFKNFMLHNNGLLLTTTTQLIKFLTSYKYAKPMEHLEIKQLIIAEPEFIQALEPYQIALAQKYTSFHEEYIIPQTLMTVHEILDFFTSSELRQVFVGNMEKNRDLDSLISNYIETVGFRVIK